MKKYIRTATKLFNYQGKMLRAEEGESKVDTINRYKAMWEQEAADKAEADRLAKEEKATRQAERRKTPRYKEGTVVMTKDGDYYQVFEPYYNKYTDEVFYDGVPCDEKGNWILDLLDQGPISEEISQQDIKRKVKESRL